MLFETQKVGVVQGKINFLVISHQKGSKNDTRQGKEGRMPFVIGGVARLFCGCHFNPSSAVFCIFMNFLRDLSDRCYYLR